MFFLICYGSADTESLVVQRFICVNLIKIRRGNRAVLMVEPFKRRMFFGYESTFDKTENESQSLKEIYSVFEGNQFYFQFDST